MPRHQIVYHSHHLDGLDRLEQQLVASSRADDARRRYLDAARSIRHRFDRRGATRWKVITLVRDPVARNLSAFFFTLAEDAPELYRSSVRGRVDYEGLRSRFIESFDHDFALDWFDAQFEPVFGLDPFDQPFPTAAGYQIRPGEGFDLLFARTEDMNRCLRPAIRDLLGWRDCRPTHVNRGSDHAYASAYRAFLRGLCLPDDYLDYVYDSPISRHFYRPAEIAAFRHRWRTGKDRSSPLSSRK